MKLNSKMIATIAAFATVFAVATMQNSDAQAGPWNWSIIKSISSSDLGSGRYR